MIGDATDLSSYIPEILDCGYTGPVNMEQKESILREGLEVYNLAQVIKLKPDKCHSLFVIGNDDKTQSQKMVSLLYPW
uniref:Uncharacterized protein n=1 Tax=Nothobranchius kuhntae TaxID=321403 RepID=A0A1A8JDW1_NOTKU